MGKVPIDILDMRTKPSNDILTIVKCLNEIQTSFAFEILDSDRSVELSLAMHSETDGAEFLDAVALQRSKWKGHYPYVYCLFDTPVSLDGVNNLFSVDSASSGIAIVTTSNVGSVLMDDDKVPSYIIFELSFMALKFIGGDLPFHDEDRDCIFDYREKKMGINSSITAAKICDSCKRLLNEKERNISATQLSSIYKMLQYASKLRSEKDAVVRKPLLFIGSSVEGLPVAQALQSELEYDYDVEIWNQSEVFGLGTSTLEALENSVLKYDFAVFVFTPDDKLFKREKEEHVARDNVIFEAGLFIGKLGRYRSFVVKPRGFDVQTPSDLHGITVADYDQTKSNIKAAVGSACSKLRLAITRAQSLQ